VKVQLYLGPLAGELAAELPFTLIHPMFDLYSVPVFVTILSSVVDPNPNPK
jgi:hypothetical protein